MVGNPDNQKSRAWAHSLFPNNATAWSLHKDHHVQRDSKVFEPFHGEKGITASSHRCLQSINMCMLRMYTSIKTTLKPIKFKLQPAIRNPVTTYKTPLALIQTSRQASMFFHNSIIVPHYPPCRKPVLILWQCLRRNMKWQIRGPRRFDSLKYGESHSCTVTNNKEVTPEKR